MILIYYRKFQTKIIQAKLETETLDFKAWKTWRSEQKIPLFKIIDDYDPFDEPETSVTQSIKSKISSRFTDKKSHKEKWENIRKTCKSSYSKRRNIDIPLTNWYTVASLQAEHPENIGKNYLLILQQIKRIEWEEDLKHK